jgi:tetratricopeptide (TPR) repeat protein
MVVGGLHARSAAAQSNDAISRQLFDQGRQLAASNQYVEACPKFEDAYRLHPGLGILLNLADCWEHLNRTASAWAAYMRVVDEAHRSKQSDRESIARARAESLEKRLSRLLIRVESKDAGLEIIRDSVPVGAAQWGVALPVDPGPHVVEQRCRCSRDSCARHNFACATKHDGTDYQSGSVFGTACHYGFCA